MATHKTAAKKAIARNPRSRVRISAVPAPDAPTLPSIQLKPIALPKGDIMVNVARQGGYMLTRDDRTVVTYPAGVQRMPEKDAEHWWSITHGLVAKL